MFIYIYPTPGPGALLRAHVMPYPLLTISDSMENLIYRGKLTHIAANWLLTS